MENKLISYSLADGKRRKQQLILKAFLDARSSGISEIVRHMDGRAMEANTKKTKLKDGDPDTELVRLYNDDAPCVIVDMPGVES